MLENIIELPYIKKEMLILNKNPAATLKIKWLLPYGTVHLLPREITL